MLSALIKKEIRANLVSFRFVAVAAMVLIVVPVAVLILANDAVKKVDEFSMRRNETENYLKSYAHFNRLQNVVQPSQPPLASYALVRGISSDVNIEEFDDDPLPVMFPLLDLTFVVAILLSLAALIFSYDAVCGEKEDGTLKLMLANGLPRAKILLGKVVGGTVTLLVPFILALILGLFVILLNPRLAWSGAEWTALGVLVVGAALYIFFFFALGVFISARHPSSSASIMTSLCAWVVFVLVLPNLSPYLAALAAPAPSRIKVGREAARLTDVDRDALGQKLMKERLQEFYKKYPALREDSFGAEAKARAEKDPAFKATVLERTREVEAAWAEANRIQGAKASALWDDLRLKEEAQTRLSKMISMISPSADFSYLATDLTSTGLMNQAHFAEAGRLWGRAYGDYVKAKTADLQKKDPLTDWWNTAVDVSDMPRFQYREEAVGARIAGVLPAMGILAGLGLLAFAAAFGSFVKYDVR
jgi:ABC-type transport system involved in multi-copper enzyme maturation permease subunit